MKLSRIIIILCLFAAGQVSANKKTLLTKDIFGSRVFVENRGQFNRSVPGSPDIKFAYENGAERVYFTPTGVIYKLVKKFPLTERMREDLEHGKNVQRKPDEVYYVNMQWLNANSNVQIIEDEKQAHYFTYGGSQYNSSTYKKITYKNVYNHIDIEYVFTDDKEYGVKYNVIAHPGANLNDIKIAYSGDVTKMVKRNSEVIIKTPLDNITEHAPQAYYNGGEKVECSYQVNEQVISFNVSGYDNSKELVIDPWVTTLTQMPVNTTGYDVDYDYTGNMFVYGGFQLVKVTKYDPLGNILWTFSGSLPGIPWNSDGDIDCVGNFIVNKIDGKTYVATGFEFNGARVIRLDAAGNYDNFVTTPIATQREIWDMGFHCGSGKVYGLGGGTFGNTCAGLIDQQTATVQAANFTGLAGSSQDIVSNAIDDNGNIFVYFTGPSVNNKILLVNPAFNGNIWFVPSTYSTFNEAVNKQNYQGANLPFATSNGFNCLAVNYNYLFFYDGFNLAAYNKANGSKIAFTTVAGQTAGWQGGIAVDDCNNVYVGGNGNIKVFSFNGTTFSAQAPIALGVNTQYQYVFDIKLNKYNNTLFVAGSGFAGTYSATQVCANANGMALSASCAGNNNGTGVVTLTTAIPNPTINYIWTLNGTTVSATYSTGALSNTATALTNGTYVVQAQINPPCGPVQVNTVVVSCCGAFNVVPTATQVGCTYTQNAVSISIVGGGTVTPTIVWSPTPGALANNSLSATGLPPGTTTISVSYGQGCVTTATVNMKPVPPPLTFTINNLTGSYSITCLNPTVNLQAVTNYTFGPVSYSWTSISFTANTNTVALTQANTLTVTITDPATGCSTTNTVAVGINTLAPTNTVNPASQIITCNSGSPVTFTGTCSTPTVNIQQDWFSPLNPPPGGVPISSSNNTLTVFDVTPYGPGIYTLVTTNLVNGCKTSKTITVTTLSAWPTFSVASPTNYSIGCAPLNQTTINIINPISTQTPPATCSYTFLPPTFTGAVTPSVILGGNTSTTTTIPGSWTVIVQDNSNFCRTTLVVPIIQNTVAPNVSANMLTQTLTCNTPTILATGTSTTANTNITWLMPVVPPSLGSPTLVIGTPPTGPNNSTTSLNYASFTVVATNSVNACQSTSVVVINQNFKPPVSTPTISIGTATAIYCTAATNPVVLTTGSSTVTSGVPFAFASPYLWEGPSPQTTVSGASSYSCYVPGIYSLTIQDSYNGCLKTGTIQVLDKTQPPVLTSVTATSTLDCGSNQASLLTSVIGSSTGLMYWYYGFPTGAAFSPTSAPIPHGTDPIFNGTTSNSVSVSMGGVYNYVVTNTLTGCRAFGQFTVLPGDITADFSPNPATGYAPLSVDFTNNSSTSLGTGSITSIWNFGNGTSQTYTYTSNATTTFTAPGTYTVMLLAQKGSCIDTAYKVVVVDMPSALEVPNIFTPNGDGNNDVFFLKTANLSEVYCLIHDRWGNKVYETTSSTGNIAWDGKNIQGKECSQGVYFYVIKAKGRDDKEYSKKGNVTLAK
jgi:gliding motility-associated-like protein